MQTVVNSHFVNTCTLPELDIIIQTLKITPKQVKVYLTKGASSLRAYVGTKLAIYLSANNIPELVLTMPASKAQPNTSKAQPNSNPFGTAGANSAKTSANWLGGYTLVKKGLKAPVGDPKWEIWSVIYASTTFAEVFAKAPAKIIKTGGKTIATPKTELAWGLKQGWLVRTA